MEEKQQREIDLDKVYDYAEYPVKQLSRLYSKKRRVSARALKKSTFFKTTM
ncbi:hypothetical protein [Priestia megaterium]|uniref:hypothetical protein n=1 Tax=Priestia megaterium TaxID=1404 RepID=UPI001A950A49|nr:hypothetical protein [Priestia megaterium]QSX24143.1 hypothetical protein J0P05_31440 [Priestia megaterium]